MEQALKPINKDYYQEIMPRFLEIANEETFKKELSFAVQIMSTNQYLQTATRDSILKSVLNIAQVGLTLNPISRQAYLIPRRIADSLVCVLEPSYIGLCKLAQDTGTVKQIFCNPVYQNDEVEFDAGKNEISHKPSIFNGGRGELKGFYAVAVLTDGGRQVEAMDLEQINEIRARSESYRAYLKKEKEGKKIPCTWVSDYGEMARKTVIKRLYKYLPKSDASYKIEQAIDMDNQVQGYELKATWSTIEYIESLLRSSTVDDDKASAIQQKLNDKLTMSEANDIIENLKVNQLNRVQEGSASQKEIQEQLESQS